MPVNLLTNNYYIVTSAPSERFAYSQYFVKSSVGVGAAVGPAVEVSQMRKFYVNARK